MIDIKSIESIIYKIDGLLDEAGLGTLDQETVARFEAYLTLILRWNARTNLTAVRDPEGILRREDASGWNCDAAGLWFRCRLSGDSDCFMPTGDLGYAGRVTG